MRRTCCPTIQCLAFLAALIPLFLVVPQRSLAQFNLTDLTSLLEELPEEGCMALAQLEEVVQVGGVEGRVHDTCAAGGDRSRCNVNL